MECRIHESAIVEKGAELGRGVEIGPFSLVSADAVIGDGVRIGERVSILGKARLGRGCAVHPGSVIGDVPQDLAFSGADTYVEIGTDCIIREGVTVHRGTKPGTSTVIGRDCFLMAFSHCAHNVRLSDGVVLANGVLLAGYVEVGEGAFISGNVSVHQFNRIGRLAMVGGNSAVNKDVPPFMTVRPASLNGVAGVNSVGLKRAGIKAEQRQSIKKAYGILYKSGLNASQAARKIRDELAGLLAEEIADFVDSSKRGICV